MSEEEVPKPKRKPSKHEKSVVRSPQYRKLSRQEINEGTSSRAHDSKDSPADYTQDEIDFMMAMDRWKHEHGKPHPDIRDVLNVLKTLGYTLVKKPKE